MRSPPVAGDDATSGLRSPPQSPLETDPSDTRAPAPQHGQRHNHQHQPPPPVSGGGDGLTAADVLHYLAESVTPGLADVIACDTTDGMCAQWASRHGYVPTPDHIERMYRTTGIHVRRYIETDRAQTLQADGHVPGGRRPNEGMIQHAQPRLQANLLAVLSHEWPHAVLRSAMQTRWMLARMLFATIRYDLALGRGHSERAWLAIRKIVVDVLAPITPLCKSGIDAQRDTTHIADRQLTMFTTLIDSFEENLAPSDRAAVLSLFERIHAECNSYESDGIGHVWRFWCYVL